MKAPFMCARPAGARRRARSYDPRVMRAAVGSLALAVLLLSDSGALAASALRLPSMQFQM